MTDVFERYYVDLEFGEEYRGVYLIRGENVVMVGQLVRVQSCQEYYFSPSALFKNRMKKNSKQSQNECKSSNVPSK